MSHDQSNPSHQHSHSGTPTDRIDKEVLLRAPRSRVWKALTDSTEFGAWFGVSFDAPFAAGKSAHARIVRPPQFSHLTFEFVVEQIVPEKTFSYRWHPAAIDSKVDYSKEPMTTVTFTLEEAPGGTLLRVSETGFLALPAPRIADSLRMNTHGWEEQMRNVEKYVAQAQGS